ncbi:uncharacterized protein LOC113541109 [Tachysurus ichikawai]
MPRQPDVPNPNPNPALFTESQSTEPTVRGLLVILGDDASMFFKRSSNLNDEEFLDIPVGILCHEDNRATSPASTQLNTSSVGIILEGSLVDALTNLKQCPSCLALPNQSNWSI